MCLVLFYGTSAVLSGYVIKSGLAAPKKKRKKILQVFGRG